MVLFKNALQNAANFIMDGLFPVFCFGCLKNGSYLCEACAKKVPLQNTKKRPLCATSYKNDLARQLIHAFKYEQVKSATRKKCYRGFCVQWCSCGQENNFD